MSDDSSNEISKRDRGSVFDARTDSWSAVQYFQFYSYLSQQQNMMQVRCLSSFVNVYYF